jgi:glycosyltransferase involved in cell wall biosynthesis
MGKTIMLHGVPMWAPSGYGVQLRLLAHGLRDLGHEVVISSYGGFLKEGDYEGFRVLGCGGSSKGVGRIAYNYRRANADLMITICDLWPLDAREFKDLNVVSWLPVDCEPLGMPDRIQLRAATELCASFKIIAMSEHGQRMLAAQGYQSRVIPHMVDEVYATGDRKTWREENSISKDVVLLGTVGVNGDYPCRKGFPELLAAFQPFSQAHPDARLYMHTLASPGVEGVDLIEIARSLGLRDKVGFPDQLMRLADEHDAAWMASMMRACDAGVFATLGEGFCVPAQEFQACGTPVLVSDNSALRERVTRDAWKVRCQPTWNKLHQAWWGTPRLEDLASGMEMMYAHHHALRGQAATDTWKYRPKRVMKLWDAFLTW